MCSANVALVQDLYAAFARGQIEAIVAACAPDVDWRVVSSEGGYPLFGEWRGPEEVRRFFQGVAALEDFHDFSPQEFHGSGDKVFVLGVSKFAVRTTGRTVTGQWCHVFTVRDGLIDAFREFIDTAQIVAAYRP